MIVAEANAHKVACGYLSGEIACKTPALQRALLVDCAAVELADVHCYEPTFWCVGLAKIVFPPTNDPLIQIDAAAMVAIEREALKLGLRYLRDCFFVSEAEWPPCLIKCTGRFQTGFNLLPDLALSDAGIAKIRAITRDFQSGLVQAITDFSRDAIWVFAVDAFVAVVVQSVSALGEVPGPFHIRGTTGEAKRK